MLLWLQLHHVPEAAVRSVLYTLRQVFPAAPRVPGAGGSQCFLVAAAEPLLVRRSALATLDRGARARRAPGRLKYYSAEALVAWSALVTDAELAGFLRGGPRRLYTDFDPPSSTWRPTAWRCRSRANRAGALVGAAACPGFEPPLAPGEAAACSACACRSSATTRPRRGFSSRRGAAAGAVALLALPARAGARLRERRARAAQPPGPARDTLTRPAPRPMMRLS